MAPSVFLIMTVAIVFFENKVAGNFSTAAPSADKLLGFVHLHNDCGLRTSYWVYYVQLNVKFEWAVGDSPGLWAFRSDESAARWRTADAHSHLRQEAFGLALLLSAYETTEGRGFVSAIVLVEYSRVMYILRYPKLLNDGDDFRLPEPPVSAAEATTAVNDDGENRPSVDVARVPLLKYSRT
ncbi:hypothetical protein BC826DRAFT_966902 [Russula brevipes]|nr:hypothetical protein BC826DRAFT_966902 [Russula brevipes]